MSSLAHQMVFVTRISQVIDRKHIEPNELVFKLLYFYNRFLIIYILF